MANSRKSPLEKWLDIIQGGTWLFPSFKTPDKPIRKKTVHEEYHTVLQRAGLLITDYQLQIKQRTHGKTINKTVNRHKYRFHTLRHTYATHLRSKGVDIQTISELLGHAQITTTQIYAKMTDNQRQQAVTNAFTPPLTHTLQNHHPQQNQPQNQQQPNQAQTPKQYLQMQLITNQITEQEYIKKLTLLNPQGIKRIIEIKEQPNT